MRKNKLIGMCLLYLIVLLGIISFGVLTEGSPDFIFKAFSYIGIFITVVICVVLLRFSFKMLKSDGKTNVTQR